MSNPPAPRRPRPRLRRRLLATVTAALALTASVASGTGQAAPDDPLAHVRLTLDSTSDWSTARLTGVDVVTAHLTPGPGDDRAYLSGASLTVVGTAPSTASVDLLVRVAPDVGLELDKGYDGHATVRLERLGPDHAVVASLENHRQEGDRQPVSTTLAGADLGEVEVPVVDDRRLTLAFYYPWFPDGSLRPSPLLDRPSSAWRTDDPDDVAVMVDEAGGAGVDGFLVSWGDEETDGAELDLVMDAAAARGDFVVGALLELLRHVDTDLLGRPRLDVAAAAEAASAALTRADRSEYLHVGDRPVLAVFGADQVSDGEWDRLLDALAAEDPFVLGDSTDHDRRLDGVYLYDPTAPSAGELAQRYESMYRSTHLDPIVRPERPVRLFAATVAPGKGPTLGDPTGRRDRDAGARYDRIWGQATASHPEWILVTSWNEWYEETHIAPSVRYGRRALEQTATWTDRFGG